MPKDRMKWGQLLTADRYDTIATNGIAKCEATENVFQADIEQIIYSSAFRRLQGKTQVHPFPVYDYLRTRLTHTIEVAHVARRIAIGIAEKANLEITKNTKLKPRDVGDIAHAAALAHDVGNPPFGHNGEYAIRHWFKRKRAEGSPIIKDLLKDGRAGDFLFFDGNSQGFRILTRLSGQRQEGGMHLSCATLGAFTKYPESSAFANDDHPKFGFTSHDTAAASKVFDHLQLHKVASDPPKYRHKWCRHPLAFVVEAADDICYLTTDIEDAFRMKSIDHREAELHLSPIASKWSGYEEHRFKTLIDDDKQEAISYLRSCAVSAMIEDVIASFESHEDSIMRGQQTKSLLAASTKHVAAISKIGTLCRERIYINDKKLQIEAAGYHVISNLMDLFGGMILELIENDGKTKNLSPLNKGLYELLPKEFSTRVEPGDRYRAMLLLIDYIAGMTDRYALNLSQKLNGTSVTLGQMT